MIGPTGLWYADPNQAPGARFLRNDGAEVARPPLGARGWRVTPPGALLPLRTAGNVARTWSTAVAAAAFLDDLEPSAVPPMPLPIRALTLRQPWASAVAIGTKRIENRAWRAELPPAGRLIAIHAGSAYDRLSPVQWRDVRLWWPRLGKGRSPALPAGQVVAVARLEAIETAPIAGTRPPPPWAIPSPVEGRPVQWWHLAEVVAVDGPRLAGKLGLWSLSAGDAFDLTEQWINRGRP